MGYTYQTKSYTHNSITVNVSGATVGSYLRMYLRLYDDTSSVTVDKPFLVEAASFEKTFEGLGAYTHYIYRILTCDDAEGTNTDWTSGSAVEFTTRLSPPTLGVSGRGSDYITVLAYWLDSNVGHIEFYLNGVIQKTDPDALAIGYSYTYEGLKPETSYTLAVITYDSNWDEATFSSAYVIGTTTSARPDDWAWTNTPVEESAIKLTAPEWNDFCARINEFRTYKNLSAYSFTTVYSDSTKISKAICDQAWNAINAIEGHGTMPSMAVQGGPLYASFFTGLRDALNAIP